MIRGSRTVKKYLIASAILPRAVEGCAVGPARHHLSDVTRTLSVDHADGLSCPVPSATQPTDSSTWLTETHVCDAWLQRVRSKPLSHTNYTRRNRTRNRIVIIAKALWGPSPLCPHLLARTVTLVNFIYRVLSFTYIWGKYVYRKRFVIF